MSETPTLFRARRDDPRDRAADPSARSHKKAPSRAGPTSDVTRFRGALVAVIAGAAATVASALALAPPGGHGAPGPMALPHARAGLACAACHGEAAPKAPVPSAACVRCHGDHPTTRPGHAEARATGSMTCATCHAVHRTEQGVAFARGEPPVRFAPGVERALPPSAYQPADHATVALVPFGSCATCHDANAPADPIARCLLPDRARLRAARPTVCFDEHRSALRASASLGGGGVCSTQHTADRPAAWDAAREAIAVDDVPIASPSAPGAPSWLGIGALAAALAFAVARATYAIRDRRRLPPASIPEAMLGPPARVRLPQIDTTTCLGCYACVDACPYDVLEVERYVAVVARPEACCGLTLCEQRCPNGSLRITEGEPIGDRPRLSAELESSDTPGLYLAGDVTGLPLIKNAILQGARAAERIAADLARAPASDALDLLVVGAGPAGISAALRAKELGLSFEVVEQGDVAQSIRSFPRGKLVFDQPLELPIAGKLWLRESSKEELLSHWMRIVRHAELPIVSDTRMTNVRREADGTFVVTTEPREGGEPTERRAQRVLLAIGQRGTPRRLPIPLGPDVESMVHYHLADARSFGGSKVLVVGLGDVAMEAAIALARQPGTTVTVVHRSPGFSRGKARNIAEVGRLKEGGRLDIYFSSEITALAPGRATVRTADGPRELPVDAVFVLIGSIPPSAALRQAGVRTVGEGPEEPFAAERVEESAL